MKKLLTFILKILPLITIWQGLTSGGARLSPFVDTLKVSLTQYEVVEITKHLVKDIEAENKLMNPHEFPVFIKETFHNQYSVLARELAGDKKHNLSLDIWGKPFQLILIPEVGMVKVASAGPDGQIENKDDIKVDFAFETGARAPASAPRKKVRRVHEEADDLYQENPAERTPSSEEFDEEGFDRDGFNREGYDRDGYDRNGLHRSEKELAETEY